MGKPIGYNGSGRAWSHAGYRALSVMSWDWRRPGKLSRLNWTSQVVGSMSELFMRKAGVGLARNTGRSCLSTTTPRSASGVCGPHSLDTRRAWIRCQVPARFSRVPFRGCLPR